jgi:hypothetical protein
MRISRGLPILPSCYQVLPKLRAFSLRVPTKIPTLLVTLRRNVFLHGFPHFPNRFSNYFSTPTCRKRQALQRIPNPQATRLQGPASDFRAVIPGHYPCHFPRGMPPGCVRVRAVSAVLIKFLQSGLVVVVLCLELALFDLLIDFIARAGPIISEPPEGKRLPTL